MSELVPGEAAAAVTVDELVDVPVVGNTLAPATAPAPVERQRTSHVNASKLESEKVVVAAPLSFAGSAARIWKVTGMTPNPYGRIGLGVVAVLLISLAWSFVAAWYLTFGLLVVPYRLIRRGQRKNKRDQLQHREMMAAISQVAQK